MYIVTNGSYSDYSVEAAFTTREKAEKYRHFYHHDKVEEIDLDPVALDCIGNSYLCSYFFYKERLSVNRVTNEYQAEDWGAVLNPIDRTPISMHCTLVVGSESEAKTLARAKVDSFLRGESTVKGRYTKVSASMKDGMPGMVGDVFETFVTTYVMCDGKVELQYEEKADERRTNRKGDER